MTAHDGLASTAELVAVGLTRARIRNRLGSGEWERYGRGVVGLAGLELTWRRRARVALLVARGDAALAGPSAARVHGFDGYDREQRVQVVFPAHHRPVVLPPGVSSARATGLGSRHLRDVDGLRCVIRPVALVQVCAIDGVEAAGRALDSMLRAGDSATWIRTTSAELRRQGVSGPADVLRLLDQRVDGRLPRSWFQRLAKAALAGRGLHTIDEHPVRDGRGRLLAELDLAIPALLIGVECQSWRWHATPSARAHDASRKRMLRRLGWDIVEVWWSDLDDLDGVIDDLRNAVDRRIPSFSTDFWSLDDQDPVENG